MATPLVIGPESTATTIQTNEIIEVSTLSSLKPDISLDISLI